MIQANFVSQPSIRRSRQETPSTEWAEPGRDFPGNQVFTLDTATGLITPGNTADDIGHGIYFLA